MSKVGAPRGYTSRFDSWRFLEGVPEPSRTRRGHSTLFDLRIPLTFDEVDCEVVAAILREEVQEALVRERP